MRLPAHIRDLGRALSLDYARDAIVASNRLIDFGRKFGIATAFSRPRRATSDLPIDLVIPVIDKDAETLPYVIDSARECVRHPIKGFFIVCPSSSVLVKKIGREKGCEIVDEDGLVDVRPKDIRYTWKGHDRSGWMYQQFLKWSGEKFCTQRHYLVLDSDTVFIRPQVFEMGGRIVFDFCDEYHQPYFEAFERIFGIRPASPLSFTSHHALVDTELMKRLMGDIEARHGKRWYAAILDAVDEEEMSCISDYDNYAQYVLEKAPEWMRVRYWYNKSLSRKALGDIESLKRKYESRYSTLSFHSYK